LHRLGLYVAYKYIFTLYIDDNLKITISSVYNTILNIGIWVFLKVNLLF